eukprot:EG_transcript_15282
MDAVDSRRSILEELRSANQIAIHAAQRAEEVLADVRASVAAQEGVLRRIEKRIAELLGDHHVVGLPSATDHWAERPKSRSHSRFASMDSCLYSPCTVTSMRFCQSPPPAEVYLFTDTPRSGGRSGFISPSLDLEVDLQPGLADDVYNAAIGLGEMTVPAARPLEDPRRPAVSLAQEFQSTDPKGRSVSPLPPWTGLRAWAMSSSTPPGVSLSYKVPLDADLRQGASLVLARGRASPLPPPPPPAR